MTKRSIIILLSSLAMAIMLPLLLPFISGDPQTPATHTIDIEAKKYGYSPSRIVVNKGDTIILKPTSLDVTHGFLLDGYPIEAIIKQKGIAFLKYTWEDDTGRLNTDWDKVSEIEFVADTAGKFTFRCTQTCGNLHPFMIGELIVKPNTSYRLFISLSVWTVFSLLFTFKGKTGSAFSGFKRIDILHRLPRIKAIVKRRGFHFFILLPGITIFYLFILSTLWGSPVGNRNIGIIFVWILWWFILKAVLIPLGGRLWCLMCPLPAPAEWLSRRTLTAVRYIEKPFKGLHHRFTGLQRDWPRKMRNSWLQNILFMAMISFGVILITRPVATAMALLSILVASLILSVIYRHRVFCLYLCPVGGFLGTYSMASMTEVRVLDRDVCKKHKEKPCLTGSSEGWACPWNQYIGTMDRNNNCGMCMECIKSCPKDNIGFFIRPFGSDRILGGYDEMFNVIIMLTVAMVFSVTMSGPWSVIKQAANVTETGQIFPFLLYLITIWGLAFAVFPGLFMLIAQGSNRLLEKPVAHRDITLRLAYSLIPLGIFAWIAFSLSSIMVNYGYILSVLSDPLGLGWDIFGTANYPFSPFYPEWIPAIQGVILLLGLYFSVSRGYQSLNHLIPDPAQRTKAMILPSLLALLVVNALAKLYMG